MPTALIGGGLSLAQGLLGGGGQKQQSSTNQTQNIDRTSTTSQQQEQTGERTFQENPMYDLARQMLMGQMGAEFGNARKPVYGQPQQVQFMQKLNELTDAAMGQLKQTMGASGSLASGRFAGGAEGIQRDALKERVNFFSQLPFMEKQYGDNRMNGLMGLAAQWLGRGPVNERTTGSASMTGTTNEKGTTTTTGNTTATTGGVGGWRGALSNLAGFGGSVLGDVIGGHGGRWGIGGSGGFKGYDWDYDKGTWG